MNNEEIKQRKRVEKWRPPAYMRRGIWIIRKNIADGSSLNNILRIKKILQTIVLYNKLDKPYS